jgi:3-dehydroquinate dehydratase I
MSLFKIVGTVSKTETLFELLKTPEKLADCDVIELRFDEYMNKEKCLELCKNLRKHKEILLTIRTIREGGTWDISDDERYKLFSYFEKDVDLIDLELKSELIKNYSREKFNSKLSVIGSFHDYEQTPSDCEIQKLIQAGRQWGFDIIKLAVFTKTKEDVTRIEKFLMEPDICLIGMGPEGVKTRTEFPLKGSLLTYGYLDQSAAPGQLSASQLKALLR